jgi:hypothetical protein
VSNRPARVTQADISRALRAARKAGPDMAVEILANSTIRIVAMVPNPQASVAGPTGAEIVL